MGIDVTSLVITITTHIFLSESIFNDNIFVGSGVTDIRSLNTMQ
jgi:hypothetical protein